MQNENENEKLSHRDVFPALAKFIDNAWFQSEIKNLEKNYQEAIELLMVTEFADNQELRERMYISLDTIRRFNEVFKPFSKKQVSKACEKFTHV